MMANILAFLITAVIFFYILRWVFKIVFSPVVLAVLAGIIVIWAIYKWLANQEPKSEQPKTPTNSDPSYQFIDTKDDGTISTNRSYRQSGAHTHFLDVSSITGLPYRFTIAGKDRDMESIEDIRNWPVMTSKFSINGTDYYINNYFRLCAKLYEEHGRSDIADALRDRVSEMECDPLYGDELRQKSQHILRVKDIKKLSESQQQFWTDFDQRRQQRDSQTDITPTFQSTEFYQGSQHKGLQATPTPIGPSEEFLEQIRQDEEAWRREQRGLSPVDEELYKVDNMDGHTFEFWCADLLKSIGFKGVEVTPSSNDQGVDVIAEKDGIKYAIQCKCYSADLGNAPIQEVNTGKYIYHCHVGVVMTNRYFTRGAKDAATATGTLLWDRDKLIQMITGIQ